MIYSRPERLDEAADALAVPGARALAGGTDLLVRLGRDEDWPRQLVDLKGLPELHGVREEAGALRIGANASIAELLADRRLANYPELATSCRLFAARQIRQRATLGGNLANASPAADCLPPLMVHDAVFRSTRREIPAAEFCLGPGRHCLEPGELLIDILLPRPAAAASGRFHKLADRDAMAIAVVNVALRLDFDGANVTRARIALGAVAPTVIRAPAAEAELVGGPLGAERITAAAQAAMTAARPIDDLRGSADYRRRMIGRLLSYHLTALSREH